MLMGEITYDEHFGHVCTCTRKIVRDRDGEADYYSYELTVKLDESREPTESGSWRYVCSLCGSSAWSGT